MASNACALQLGAVALDVPPRVGPLGSREPPRRTDLALGMARDTGKAASERSLPGPLCGERRVRARRCGGGGLCGDGLRIRGGTTTATATATARRTHGGSAAGHAQVHGAHGVGSLVVADVPFVAIA